MTTQERKTKSARCGRPPHFAVLGPDKLPARDRPKGWDCVQWSAVTGHLESGQIVSFKIEPWEAMDFWMYAMLRIGRPFATRYIAMRKQFFIYPFVSCESKPKQRSAISATYSERINQLQLSAVRMLILVDAESWAEYHERQGRTRSEADVTFVNQRGDGQYPIRFGLDELNNWRTAAGLEMGKE